MARPLRRLCPAEGRLAADAAQAPPEAHRGDRGHAPVALSVVVVNATVASSFVARVDGRARPRLSRDLTVSRSASMSTATARGLGSRQRCMGRSPHLPRPVPSRAAGSRSSRSCQAATSRGTVIGDSASRPTSIARSTGSTTRARPSSAVLSGLAAGGASSAKSFADGQGLHGGRPGATRRAVGRAACAGRRHRGHVRRRRAIRYRCPW